MFVVRARRMGFRPLALLAAFGLAIVGTAVATQAHASYPGYAQATSNIVASGGYVNVNDTLVGQCFAQGWSRASGIRTQSDTSSGSKCAYVKARYWYAPSGHAGYYSSWATKTIKGETALRQHGGLAAFGSHRSSVSGAYG